jgi:hypothetical protein
VNFNHGLALIDTFSDLTQREPRIHSTSLRTGFTDFTDSMDFGHEDRKTRRVQVLVRHGLTLIVEAIMEMAACLAGEGAIYSMKAVWNR